MITQTDLLMILQIAGDYKGLLIITDKSLMIMQIAEDYTKILLMILQIADDHTDRFLIVTQTDC